MDIVRNALGWTPTNPYAVIHDGFEGYYLTQIEHVRDQTIKTSNSAKLVETAEATVRARNTPSASGQAENTLLGGARALANLHRKLAQEGNDMSKDEQERIYRKYAFGATVATIDKIARLNSDFWASFQGEIRRQLIERAGNYFGPEVPAFSGESIRVDARGLVEALKAFHMAVAGNAPARRPMTLRQRLVLAQWVFNRQVVPRAQRAVSAVSVHLPGF